LAHHPLLGLGEVILVFLDHIVSSSDDLLECKVLALDQVGQASVNFGKLEVSGCELFDLILHRLDLDDVSLALEDFAQVNQPDEVVDQADPLEDTVFFSAFLDLGEGLSHDGNQHVHEHDRDNESCQE